MKIWAIFKDENYETYKSQDKNSAKKWECGKEEGSGVGVNRSPRPSRPRLIVNIDIDNKIKINNSNSIIEKYQLSRSR